jgi:hypothetical protein
MTTVSSRQAVPVSAIPRERAETPGTGTRIAVLNIRYPLPEYHLTDKKHIPEEHGCVITADALCGFAWTEINRIAEITLSPCKDDSHDRGDQR